MRDPPTDPADVTQPSTGRRCDCGGFGCPACDPGLRPTDPSPPQAADQADAGGHSLTDEESRWLD